MIGALGTVPKRLPKYLEDLGIPDVIGCDALKMIIKVVVENWEKFFDNFQRYPLEGVKGSQSVPMGELSSEIYFVLH